MKFLWFMKGWRHLRIIKFTDGQVKKTKKMLSFYMRSRNWSYPLSSRLFLIKLRIEEFFI